MNIYPEVGETIGKYTIKSILGKGATATVYKAVHKYLNIEVALKILSPELIEQDKTIQERFLEEAMNHARLQHANLVRITDVEKDSQFTYMVMDFVDGDTLEKIVKKEGAIEPLKAIKIILEISRALKYALDSNMIHRDIKPANIIITKDEQVKLADFGLAKNVQEKDRFDTAGKIYGTPYYMSPEQFTDPVNVDHRSDIYSIGTTFYYILTGKLPFETENLGEIISMHIKEKAIPPNEVKPFLSKELSDFIMKLLEKNPDDRFQNYENLILELEKIEYTCKLSLNVSPEALERLEKIQSYQNTYKSFTKEEEKTLDIEEYKPAPPDINFDLPPIISKNDSEESNDIDLSSNIMKYLKTDDKLTSNLVEKFKETKKAAAFADKKKTKNKDEDKIEGMKKIKVTGQLSEALNEKYEEFNKGNVKINASGYISRIMRVFEKK